jgi:hypothetical protein
MLDEVGQALLVVVLDQRARIHHPAGGVLVHAPAAVAGPASGVQVAYLSSSNTFLQILAQNRHLPEAELTAYHFATGRGRRRAWTYEH